MKSPYIICILVTGLLSLLANFKLSQIMQENLKPMVFLSIKISFNTMNINSTQ